MKKTILSLLVALTATTGAWADNLYLEVSGTTATLKYGDKGDNPYYYNSYGTMYWSSNADDAKSTVTTINVHTSCASHDLTKLQNLFNYFTALETINGLENLKTTGVTNMTFMFGSCGNLTAVDVSGFNTASVEDMQNMFYNCDELVTLDLSGWNTGSVTDMSNMFSGCTDLVNIYVGNDWSVTNVKWDSNMFYNCVSLPGFNSSYVDKTRAHTGDGGYLKTKPAPAGPTTSGITWNTGTNSGTFAMPAYDVEVSTELWYILKQNGETPAANKSKTNVFLDRTLQAKVGGDDAWNTFCVPFPISAEKVMALGMTVKQLSSTSFSNGTLTLDFTDVTTGIAAGTPYLVRVASNLDFTADGNEFEGVSQDWETTHPVTPGTDTGNDCVTFVPVLTPTPINDNTKLYLGGAKTLYYPSSSVNVKGFRAYFQLNKGLTAGTPSAGIRAFNLNIDGDQTGIRSLTPDASPKGEGSIYSLDGRKVQNTTRKGVYIVNGKKVVVK